MGEEDLVGFFLFIFGGFLLLFVVVVGFVCLFSLCFNIHSLQDVLALLNP